MARTSTMNTPDELRHLEAKALQKRDRFVLGVVQGQRALMSKAKKRELARYPTVNSPMVGRGSLFKYFSPLWRALDSGQKQAWKDAGVYSFISGWQLFVSDGASRIKNYLTIGSAPSELWQVRTGHIVIESPASNILLQQQHPLDYWVTEKIRGKPWKQALVLLRESFSLPLGLEIRYKSDLTPVGDTQVARFYARVRSSYQGVDRFTDITINISPSEDWTFEEASSGAVLGHIISYTLFIEISGYRGEVLIDNLRVLHSGFNWARDPRCDEVQKIFMKAFAIVQPFWERVDVPSGSSFVSVYPPAL